jgi:hypothetical protein
VRAVRHCKRMLQQKKQTPEQDQKVSVRLSLIPPFADTGVISVLARRGIVDHISVAHKTSLTLRYSPPLSAHAENLYGPFEYVRTFR